MGWYYWPNGNRFYGKWANKWRNGKGTLYLKDSSYFEGTWLNDSLTGVVVLKSKEGKVIDKSIYKMNRKIGTIKVKSP